MKSKLTILTLSVLLMFVLLGGPQIAAAQQSPTSNAGTTQAPEPLPNAPSAQARSQQAQSPNSTPQPATQKQEQNPLGAAAAQQGVTAGGAASKPAGNAIAPAKQHQTRSLLLKLGMIGAAGAAIGAVVALSRGTSPVPPGSGR